MPECETLLIAVLFYVEAHRDMDAGKLMIRVSRVLGVRLVWKEVYSLAGPNEIESR